MSDAYPYKRSHLIALRQSKISASDPFNCVVIIIHHCGVDGARPRGQFKYGLATPPTGGAWRIF
jgi:hypothetical protein